MLRDPSYRTLLIAFVTSMSLGCWSLAQPFIIEIESTLSSGWTGSGTEPILTGDRGSLNVGYITGPVSGASSVTLMEQVALGKDAKGFTYNGEVSGWDPAYVGYHTLPGEAPVDVKVGKGTYSTLRVRNNGPGTTNVIVYTSGIKGQLDFDITAFNNGGADDFEFGVFSVADDGWLAGGVSDGVQQLLCSDPSVSAGDQYFIAFVGKSTTLYDARLGGSITATPSP